MKKISSVAQIVTAIASWLMLIMGVLFVRYLWTRIIPAVAPAPFSRAPVFPTMPGELVLFFAIAFAFMWVKKLRWGVTKPFNCLGCMSGWTAVIVAFLFHTPFWYFYLPAGLFIGSLVDAAIIKYL